MGNSQSETAEISITRRDTVTLSNPSPALSPSPSTGAISPPRKSTLPISPSLPDISSPIQAGSHNAGSKAGVSISLHTEQVGKDFKKPFTEESKPGKVENEKTKPKSPRTKKQGKPEKPATPRSEKPATPRSKKQQEHHEKPRTPREHLPRQTDRSPKVNPRQPASDVTSSEAEGFANPSAPALQRSRGYTHVGFSSFFPPGEHADMTPPLVPSSIPGHPVEQRAKETPAPSIFTMSDDSPDKIRLLMNAEGKDRLPVIGGMKREQLETRPRSSSLIHFGVPGEEGPGARQTSLILAALKRASQRIELNIKNKLVKAKMEVVRSPQERAATKIQATFRMWIAVKSYKTQLQRASVVREILITELDYVRFLNVLVKVYFYPLRKANILSTEELNKIFPQIEIIKIYNTKFVELLQNKMREWNVYQTIGDAFLSMVDNMREPYAIYISQFPDISTAISSCSQRLPVANFLKKCTKFTEVASMDLLSLASMPFQRIPRYMLLLKECLKFTSKTHRDHELIRVAIKKLDLLTQSASERLRMTESSKSVVRVSEMCDPPVENLVRPYRKLLRDSGIDAQFIPALEKPKDNPMVKNCRLFLFTDCLLLTKPFKKSFFGSNSELKLKPIAILDLRGAVLGDAPNVNEFRLQVQAGLAIFQTPNWPEKEAWKSDISDAVHLLAEDTATVRHSEALSRSSSVTMETPMNKEKLVRTRSQFTPSTPAEKQKKAPRPAPKRLTRQFTIPQIADLFLPQKLAAPKVNRARLLVGRSASHKSFFMLPGTTQRKQKETPAIMKDVQRLRKTQSLNSLSLKTLRV